MSDHGLSVETLEREQRLKVCACCSIGTYVRSGQGFLSTYTCPECQALNEELTQALKDYEARIERALSEHHALHEQRANAKDADEQRLFDDLLNPAEEPKSVYVPPVTQAWIPQEHPELDWLVHLCPEERAFYKAHRASLKKRFPDVPEAVWRVLLG